MDVAAAIDRTRAWAVAAACAREDPEWWFSDSKTLKRMGKIGSPVIVLPLLICEGCSVRRSCLEAAFEPISYTRSNDAIETSSATEGVWGATTLEDRLAAAGMPLDDAVDLLERTLPERMAGYIDAFSRLDLDVPRTTKRRRRVREMIAARSSVTPVLKRFHLHVPGPGRGHRGPIAIYAAAHGCSRSTAWRRLRAVVA